MPNVPAKRWWQTEADESFANIVNYGGKGQLILPTGTGKTRIAINQMAHHQQFANRHGFYGVIVPRLLLSTQWFQEIANYFLGIYHQETNTIMGGLGVPVSFLIVSTGNIGADILGPIRACLYAAIGGHAADALVVTTNSKEIRNQVAMRQREKKSTVVAISTYHSSERLSDASQILPDEVLKANNTHNIGPIDICFYDECHYLVNGRLEEVSKFESALCINASSKVFMTATPKNTEKDWEWGPNIEAKGMQNEERFGEVIYYKSPLEMIEAGAIVGPKAYLIGSDETETTVANGQRSDNKLMVCHNALQHLRSSIAQESFAPEKLGAKMLVVCDGQETLKRIFSCKETFHAFRDSNPKLKVYGLCSDFGCYIDGVWYENVTNSVKDKLLLALRTLSPSDEAIVFHVDMISEGLDVPGINAILPFKNCGTIKFLQNLGRATRLHIEDANRLFTTGELKPSKTGKNYIKPCCNVYLPYLFEGRDEIVDECLEKLADLVEVYDFDSSELLKLAFTYPAENPEDFGTAAIRQSRDSKYGPEIKTLHIEKVEKKYGLKKYRWSRFFFSGLTDEQINAVIDSTPSVVVTPVLNFG